MLNEIPGWMVVFFGTLLYLSVRIILLVCIGHWTQFNTRFGKNRRIYRVDYPKSQFRSEIRANAKVILSDAVFLSAVSLSGIIQYSPHTLWSTLSTVGLMAVWWEIGFYFVHRLLHTPSFFWIHAQHHTALVAHPLSIMSYTVLEKIILTCGVLIVPFSLSPFMPITLEGVLIYGVLSLSMNFIGHGNIELFPSWFAESQWGKYVNTPTFHSMHHSRIQGHFGLWTTFLDRWLGTYHPDYPIIQRLAADGSGPSSTSFRARNQNRDQKSRPLSVEGVAL